MKNLYILKFNISINIFILLYNLKQVLDNGQNLLKIVSVILDMLIKNYKLMNKRNRKKQSNKL